MLVPEESATTRRQIWRARLLVLAAAALWSTSGFFVKSPYFVGWSGPTLAFWRAIFACGAPWLLVRERRYSWKLAPMTLLFAGMNFTYLTAMAKGSAANAIWLQCTAPVWVFLVGVLLLGERAVRRDWIMVGCAAAGVGVILFFESRGANPEAVAWGLASSLFYAGVVLMLRWLRDYDSAWLAALNLLVTAIVMAPFAVAESRWPSGIQWIMLIAFGALQMGLPYIFFARGLKEIPGHEAAGIALLEPLLVPVWVYLAWGDRPAWWTLAGGGLILVGLAARYVEVPRKTPAIRN